MSLNHPLILIADDDEDDQQLLQEVLQNLTPDLTMLGMSGGRELLNYLRESGGAHRPNLLVLDYNMPDMNALEVLDSLKGDQNFQALPVVVWSTSNLDQTAKRCIESGAKEYFVKPIDLAEAMKMAQKMLLHSVL